MRLIFVRHGATRGNMEGRYVGATDEPLCPQGEEALRGRSYPPAQLLFASPLRRCLQTAQIIYPALSPIVLPGLREMDFGEWEYKNYRELQCDARYQAWIDGGGRGGFPGGEDQMAFRRRCEAAFARALPGLTGARSAAFVVHGGTIMALLARYAEPARDYFDWQVENGGGYLLEWDGRAMRAIAWL